MRIASTDGIQGGDGLLCWQPCSAWAYVSRMSRSRGLALDVLMQVMHQRRITRQKPRLPWGVTLNTLHQEIVRQVDLSPFMGHQEPKRGHIHLVDSKAVSWCVTKSWAQLSVCLQITSGQSRLCASLAGSIRAIA